MPLFGVFLCCWVAFDQGETPPHLNAEPRTIFRLSHDPNVNMLMLILFPMFAHSPSPHSHASGCSHTLAPHVHDISHAGLTPLMKSTSCSSQGFFSSEWLEVVWWKSLFCLIGLKSSQAAGGEIFGLHLLVVAHRLDVNGSVILMVSHFGSSTCSQPN